MRPASNFVISLDFELMWGVRDHKDKSNYGHVLLGAREAVRRMLELFSTYEVRATWATVGFLFCESKAELIDSSPKIHPEYDDRRLSNYDYFDDVGDNEKKDPTTSERVSSKEFDHTMAKI